MPQPVKTRSTVARAAWTATGAGVQNSQRKRKDPRAIRRRGKTECRTWQ